MTGAKTAVEWLASVAPDPEACRWEWERNPLGVALLPAGKAWDVLILPGELGYPTLDVLTRILDRLGPVLVDFGDARMGFFVPPGTAARWLGTGIRTAGAGTWIVVPYPGRVAGEGCAGWSRRTAPAFSWIRRCSNWRCTRRRRAWRRRATAEPTYHRAVGGRPCGRRGPESPVRSGSSALRASPAGSDNAQCAQEFSGGRAAPGKARTRASGPCRGTSWPPRPGASASRGGPGRRRRREREGRRG